jgi:hypothetical protein
VELLLFQQPPTVRETTARPQSVYNYRYRYINSRTCFFTIFLLLLGLEGCCIYDDVITNTQYSSSLCFHKCFYFNYFFCGDMKNKSTSTNSYFVGVSPRYFLTHRLLYMHLILVLGGFILLDGFSCPPPYTYVILNKTKTNKKVANTICIAVSPVSCFSSFLESYVISFYILLPHSSCITDDMRHMRRPLYLSLLWAVVAITQFLLPREQGRPFPTPSNEVLNVFFSLRSASS